MRRNDWIVAGVLLAIVISLAGCGGAATPAPKASAGTPVPAGGNSASAGAEQDYASAALPTSYDNALPASTQLALGIFRLEGTPLAVTQAQAKTLLPLWQAFEGSALQNQAEQNAVLKQIEGTLTPDQVRAIAGMYLTTDDMRKWMDEHGVQLRAPAGGTPGPGGGNFGNMTDEQRQALRATAQAGGGAGPQGGGNFGNMTDEQRQAFRATVQVGGGQFARGQGGTRVPFNGTPGPGARGNRFFGGYRIFVAPLVELLTQRAGG